jgi:hypothetical protein
MCRVMRFEQGDTLGVAYRYRNLRIIVYNALRLQKNHTVEKFVHHLRIGTYTQASNAKYLGLNRGNGALTPSWIDIFQFAGGFPDAQVWQMSCHAIARRKKMSELDKLSEQNTQRIGMGFRFRRPLPIGDTRK